MEPVFLNKDATQAAAPVSLAARDAPERAGAASIPEAARILIRAGDEGDRLVGGGDADRLTGGRGDDRLVGRAGEDTLLGRGGDDTLLGGGGADRLLGGGDRDELKGGGGDDTLKGGGGEDKLKGGGGADRLLGGAGGDDLRGGAGDDTLKGGGGEDRLMGGGGDDSLNGGRGADVLAGGAGADTIRGGAGADTLRGQGGDDVFLFTRKDLAGGDTDVIVGFRSGSDRIDIRGVTGFAGIESLIFGERDGDLTVEIGGGTIVFRGRSSDAPLEARDFGLSENVDAGPVDNRPPPTPPVVTPPAVQPPVVQPPVVQPPVVQPPATKLDGGPEGDRLFGSAANERLNGEGGADTLEAGAGADTLTGGAGADVFLVRLANDAIDPQPDSITDFSIGFGDRMDLTEALAGLSFEDIAEVVQLRVEGQDTVVSINRGAGFADVLRLEGVALTLSQLALFGMDAPSRSGQVFVSNPFGFTNLSNTASDPSVTPDGRFVVFADKQNLDGSPTDEPVFRTTEDGFRIEEGATLDVFLRNVDTGATIRVSGRDDGSAPVDFGGNPARAASPDVTPDGRFVAFVSDGLLSADAEASDEGGVYIRDMSATEAGLRFIGLEVPLDDDPFGRDRTLSAKVVAISDDGSKIAYVSGAPEIFSSVFGVETEVSADGRDVFYSDQTFGSFNVIDGVHRGLDIYLHDAATGETRLVSGRNEFEDDDFFVFEAGGLVPDPYPNTVFIDGPLRDGGVAISGDGGLVAFVTGAQLTADDQDDALDVYIRDWRMFETRLVSVGTDGADAFGVSLSADGTRIAFTVDRTGAPGAAPDEFGTRIVEIDRSDLSLGPILDLTAPAGLGYLNPTLSPDGARIGLARYDSGGFETTIEVRDLATGLVTIRNASPDFFAGGSEIGPGLPGFDLSDSGIAYRVSTGDGGDSDAEFALGDSLVFETLLF